MCGVQFSNQHYHFIEHGNETMGNKLKRYDITILPNTTRQVVTPGDV